MAIAKLRAVGGSTVVAIPPALLQELGLGPQANVELHAENGSLVIRPVARRRYTLDELMSQCDLSEPMTKAERDWQSAPAAGNEEL
jgi:antitoxin ChpS